MRPKQIAAKLIFLLTLMLLAGNAMAAGLLKPVGANDSAALAISSHKVDVTINNGFVRTEVDQTFANSSGTATEVIYSFPLPKQSSLSELSLWIAGQEILGEVVEKQRARQIYEEQKAQGNQTALAEKNDYRSYDVKVGNIPAQSDVRVRLVYYQPLEIDLNIGRYIYPQAEGNVDEERISFWSTDDKVSGPFHFHLQLKSAFPVKDVRLPGLDQEAIIQRSGGMSEENAGDIIDVTIDRPEGSQLNKDIVFYYRLDDSVPARIELVPYKADKNSEGTFMLVVTPAADLQPISEGTDWTFVLDNSGSMGGHKISTLTDGVNRVLGQMRANDRFRIITFNNSAQELTSGYINATTENVQQWISALKNIQAGGGTNLFAGLESAYRKLDEDRTSSIILVTDGVANVGNTAHKDFLRLLQKYDIRLFTFVIGNSANQPLLDRLARDSGGFAMNISDADDISGRLLQAKAKVLHQALHDVEIDISGERVTDLTPEKIGNLYAGQQLVQFGRYNSDGEVTIKMKAKISGQPHSWKTTANLPQTATDNPELERLWALAKIDQTMEEVREKGEIETLKNKVIDYGLNYSLVTDYTSMLVVTVDVLENQGIQRRNADRVQKERIAQQQKAAAPVQNHRIDQSSNNGAGSFNNRPSPGINFGSGSGPVGLLTIPLLAWMNRKKK
ncbi:Ca-activated chloride channel family protein [Malonomonas rubra DSM 5091]|uniref:Ca-activated chloride channel family protein n=1 Tax=Malonomonas rubra DSM 5091 TaxID=1122189 RepID=A0A1M6CIR6_MALRU|nr:VIT domain-containing protein [Malonomonas rubra]SHI60879.1 Ca-activated chloride channel family protein [Malonomonas rubra DSM 5091]